jgi:hypothetical protein
VNSAVLSDAPHTGRWQEAFLAILPAIETHAQISFRRLAAEAREEAVANAVALAYMGYHSLARRGRLGQAYASTLATYAVKATWSGRVAGSGQSAGDALSRLAQRRHGFFAVNLGLQHSPVWREVVRAGRGVDPADQAVFNLDFELWLRSLSRRLRRMVGLFVAGWRSGQVARRLRLSAGRISQLRRWLEQSWQRFQGLELVGSLHA